MTRIVLSAVTLMVVMLVTPARAASPQERVVSVIGQAEVNVVPDEVVMRAGVQSRDKSLSVARKQNDLIASRLIATARRFGVEEKNVRTGNIQVQTRYQAGKLSSNYDSALVDFYEVTKVMVIVLRDVSRFESLMSAVLEEGANRISEVEFNTTELRKHRDRARQLAVAAARDKAVLLAGELGMKVGKPISINEGDATGWQRPWNGNTVQRIEVTGSRIDAGGTSSVALGEIGVTATVSVQFELLE